MPQGILNASSGIPICDVGPATPAGQFSWRDCVMLKMELPMEWQANGSFFMNQRTFALLITMSDGLGRPLWGQLPSGLPGFILAGSPINIVTWMPDVAPGSTPIAYGDWKQAYAVVNRRATTMVTDPYSAGFCTLFKFEARRRSVVPERSAPPADQVNFSLRETEMKTVGSVALALVLASSESCYAQMVVKQEPWEGKMAPGQVILVDDGTCGKGKIKEVTGGELGAMNPRPRTKRCIPKGKM